MTVEMTIFRGWDGCALWPQIFFFLISRGLIPFLSILLFPLFLSFHSVIIHYVCVRIISFMMKHTFFCCCCRQTFQNKKNTDLWIGVDSRSVGVYDRENRLTPKIAFQWSEIKNIAVKDKKVSTSFNLSYCLLLQSLELYAYWFCWVAHLYYYRYVSLIFHLW